MTKITQFFAVAALFTLLFAFSGPEAKAQAQNQNGYVGIAHSVPGIAQCIAETRSNGLEVSSSVQEEVINCLVPPCPKRYRVTFYAQYRCRPGQICPLVIFFVAQVVIDENGNVISARCGSSRI